MRRLAARWRKPHEGHAEMEQRKRWEEYPAQMLALLEHDTDMVPPGGHPEDCPICEPTDPMALRIDPRIMGWH